MNCKNLCKSTVMPCIVAFGMILAGCAKKKYIVTSNQNNEIGYRALSDTADRHVLKYDGILRNRFYKGIQAGDTIDGYANVLDGNASNGISLEIHSVNGISLLEYEEIVRRDSIARQMKQR